MSLSIFHTVNAGLLFRTASHGIWVDGLHGGKEQGFSAFPRELLPQLRLSSGLFSHTDAMLFTHLHPDHFDASLLAEFSLHNKTAAVWGPTLSAAACPAVPLTPGVYRLPLFYDMDILAIQTTHDGAPFQGTPHVSFLLQTAERSVLIAGDALLSPEEVNRISEQLSGPLDIAFFTPFHFISPARTSIVQALAPQLVYLYHLPFPADDSHSIHRLAARTIRCSSPDVPPIRIAQSMSWLSI